MSRTRGASAFHQDDGELLDKEGNPIPTGRANFTHALAHPMPPTPAPVPPPTPTVITFLCNPTTWRRDMDGFEAMHLLNTMIGGLSVELDPEAYGRLPADLQRHFRRKAVEVAMDKPE